MPPVSRLAGGRSHNKPVTTTPLGAQSVHVGFGQQIWHVAFRFSHAWRISLASMITGVSSSPRERGAGGCRSKRLCSVSSATMVIVAADHCCALRLLSQNGFSALSLRASLKRAISRTQCSAWLECLRSRVVRAPASTARSALSRRDCARSVSKAETAAARPRGARSTARRWASAGRAHPGIPD